MRAFLETAEDVEAVGHRVVHGGREFLEPLVLDSAGIRRLRWPRRPGSAPQRPRPARAERLPRPVPRACRTWPASTRRSTRAPRRGGPVRPARDWNERFGLRRFGFHGISHAWAARRAAELLGRAQEGLRLVTCHLGAGASLAAVRHGASLDTTMGFTPNEGLVMATRSGSVDPGMLLWLIRHAGIAPDELEQVWSTSRGCAGSAAPRATCARS